MANNYKLEISYDGSNFVGFQKQDKGRTIQGELERVITRLNSQIPVIVNASGRTDAKVHALKQVCNFETEKDLDLYYFGHALNMALPHDIRCNQIEKTTSDFHPRYDAVAKQYRYLINIGEYDVFQYNYAWQINKELNIEKMIEASASFIGKHDFRTFSSATSDQDCYREIFSIDITVENNMIIIDYYGNGFLRYMVRKLTMALVDVGLNKMDILRIKELLEKKDIKAYSKVAPGQGLYLVDVKYGSGIDENENI